MPSALDAAPRKPAEPAFNGMSDKKKMELLTQIQSKLDSTKEKLGALKEHAGEAGLQLLHTGEMLGTVTLASGAEGYFGAEKLKVGGVDLRFVGGAALGFWGLYETLQGKNGGHQLAFGNGLLASGIASMAQDMGRTLAEKKGAASVVPPAAGAAAAPNVPVVDTNQAALPQPNAAGDLARQPVANILPDAAPTHFLRRRS